MNLKTISRNVGYALLVDALFMFLSLLVSVADGHDSAMYGLATSFVITFIVGAFPFIFVRRTPRITLKEGYMIVVLSWLLSFIFGMMPFILWDEDMSVADAWFESVSGFTTTGATIFSSVESLPRSLLFWRSSTHFIGGLGVSVFLLLVIPGSSPVKMRLANMELSSLSKMGYNTHVTKTAYMFAGVYIGLLVAAFIAYLLVGMGPFDAINHAMSVCATGGFSTRDMSIGSFDSRAVEAVTMLFMILGSLHFGLIYIAVTNIWVSGAFQPFKAVKVFNNPVVKFYLGMLALVAFLAALPLLHTHVEGSFGRTLWTSAFQTICMASTTGFAIADNAQWPLISNVIIMFAAITCGCAGSTTGGLKSDRMMILIKSVGCRIRHTLNPSIVDEVRIGDRQMRDEDVAPHIIYVALFAVIIFISTALAIAFGADAQDALSGSIASISNVGPAIGDIGSMGNFGGLNAGTKFLFTIDMFLGRVEIYPLLAVLAMLFSRNRK